MASQYKQRIFGIMIIAIVLVFFVWVLLRYSVASSPMPSPILLPASHAVPQKVSTMSFELPAASAPTETLSSVSAPASVVKSTAVTPLAPTTVTQTPAAAITAVHAMSAPVPVAAPAPAPAPASASASASVVTMAVPIKKTPSPETSAAVRALQLMTSPEAWVVQLCAFSSQARADHLVSVLRAQGFDVYTRMVAHEGRVKVCVFVGPKIHRADIEAIRDQLFHEFHLRGMIRKYQ